MNESEMEMKFHNRTLAILLSTLVSFAVASIVSAQNTTNENVCGGKTFPCSLHQTNAELTIIPIPTPIPNVGNLVGAGKSWLSRAYGNTVFRCTDINSDPSNTRYHSYEVTDSGGSNEGIWNANNTMLRIMDAGSGSSRVYGFTKSTGHCTTANQYSRAPAGVVWSAVNPDVDYSLDRTTLTQRTFDYLQPLKAPKKTTIFDFRSCPGLAALNPTWKGELTVTAGDGTLLTSFSDLGGQDTGEYVAAYQPSSGGCQVWNTLTGQVTAQGYSRTISTFYSFNIHNANVGPGGVAIVSAGTICSGCPERHGPFLWQAGTISAYLVEVDAGGHPAIGYTHYLNLVNSPAIDSRVWNFADDVTQVTSATGVQFPHRTSTHLAWQDVDPLDSVPFTATSATALSPPYTLVTPLEQELWGAVPATGEFIRLAPTMTSGQPNEFNFRTKYAIESMSPKGCIAWSSDWLGTLGNTDGKTTSCVLGTNPPTACRSDVFVTCPQ